MPVSAIMPKVAVVILNWNGKKFLEKFLPTVIKFSKKDAEIVVADNASNDDSVAFLKNNFPEINIIELSENYGFAGGYNKALQQIEATYYVLLNSDVEVTENWINPVVEIMEQNASVAACQPKILSYVEKSKFEYAGAAGGFIDQYGYPFCRGRVFLTTETDSGQYDNECEIFWATGACLFIRSGLFHKASGFDADFFAHMEEIDLCWRLKNMGYKIMYSPHSTVYHVGGGTLPKTNPRKTYLNFRNNLMMLAKNLPSSLLFPVLFSRLILDGIAGLKFLIAGQVPDFFSIIKAHFSFYFSIGKTAGKRKQINPKHLPSGIYTKNLVVEYYLKGRKFFTQLSGSFR